MSVRVSTGSPPVALPAIPVSAALPWLVFAALLFAVTMYFLGVESGAASLLQSSAVHEWTHDGRHLLGFPCH
ncbi:MAG TPA: CbtB domain-containing protein [Propionibacteriaceae bacterium]|nr:CbtB domain-containing protein [Propionibacteriaceae bacterium]